MGFSTAAMHSVLPSPKNNLLTPLLTELNTLRPLTVDGGIRLTISRFNSQTR